jgi:hypothetical protein
MEKNSIDEMYGLLRQLSSDFRMREERFPEYWEYPLLKYVLHTTVYAAETEDFNLMEETLELWDKSHDNSNNCYSYRDGKWLFLDATYCPVHVGLSEKHNTTYRLLTQEAMDLGFDQLSSPYTKSAWDIIDQAGLLSHVSEYGNIILHQEFVDDPVKLTAYSNLFQGIVYTDWSENPFYYAESIVHEAAHSKFNFYFQQLQLDIDSTEYWSPWRRTKRPSFGILHGAWAFSYVYRFYHQLSKQIVTSSVTEQQIGAYKERSLFEAERLKVIRPTLQEIFKRLNNAKLRGYSNN